MNKFRYLLIILWFTFNVFICTAQHMSFLDIPINGSLSSFQNKLANKGFKYNQTESRIAPYGERVFTGVLNGHKARISVFYDRKTKNVYEVELSMESDNIHVIQSLFERTLKEIERNYAYFPEHNTDDGRSLHFRYHILSQSSNAEPIGIIHVQPTYAYLFNDAGHHVGTIYVLQLNFEDKQNISLLTPSVTKPKGLKNLCINDPEKFYKYIVWANEFKKVGDLDKQIDYLMYALDYYKFNCVPTGSNITEEQIEYEIKSAQYNLVGKIPIWAGNKTANVYKCFDEMSNRWHYTFASNVGLIRIYNNELDSYIENMRKIHEIFMSKVHECTDKELGEYWRSEEEQSSLVINYGEDTFNGPYGFGDYIFRKENIVLTFGKAKTGIYIALSSPNKPYMGIMTFGSTQELEQHINFLQSLKE